MRVLQIGAGPTGVSVFRQVYSILATQNTVLDYVIVDHKEPGKGLAFGTERNSHILNLPASIMSLHPENPLEFCEWRTNDEHFWNDGSYGENVWSEFPPRRLFGKYVASTMNKLLMVSPFASLINKKVNAIYELKEPNRFLVKYEDGMSELFDKVILCIGHSPLKPFFNLPKDRYRHSSYEVENIPSNASIGIIGSRLSAIDAVLALKENNHQGKIYLASKSGVLPKVFDENKKPYESSGFLNKLLAITNPTLEEIIEIHKNEIKQVMNIDDKSLHDLFFVINSQESFEREFDLLGLRSEWQSVLFSSYSIVDQIWKKLKQADKHIFLKNYYGLWMTFLAAYPLESAKKIKFLMDNEQLKVISGLEEIKINENIFSLIQKSGNNILIDYLIDGRGVGYQEEDLRTSSLLSSLLDGGLIQVHENGGLKIDTISYEAEGIKGLTKNLHIVGDLTKGEFLSTTDVGRCVDHSVKFSNYIKQV